MPSTLAEPLTNGLFDDSNGANTGGDNHANGTGNTPKPSGLNDQYAFTPRKLRVITIGAGFSGLLMAHKFQHRFPEMQSYVEHTIFEGRKELGGTWVGRRCAGSAVMPSLTRAARKYLPRRAMRCTFTHICTSGERLQHRLADKYRPSLSIPIRIGPDSILAVPRSKSTSYVQRRSGILIETSSLTTGYEKRAG
jgi:hypothetical protein